MSGPLIGLSAYSEHARWAAWDAPAVLLPVSYTAQVQRAGGVPVLLPPAPGIAAAAARLDGLLLTGGGDIDPARYGADPHPRIERVSAERDEAELSLLAAALDAGLPVLGICRGLQLLNVGLGGTLRQHLPDGSGHRLVPGTFGSHDVKISPGTRLAEILSGAGEITVPTSHHQAVDRLADGLVAAAWAADGTVEAAEMPQRPFVLGVQWHPEAGADHRLFQALVAAAARSRGPAGAPRPLHSPA